jgi:hypothetical protein
MLITVEPSFANLLQPNTLRFSGKFASLMANSCNLVRYVKPRLFPMVRKEETLLSKGYIFLLDNLC